MYLYNVTFIADDSVATEWAEWLEQVHIPKLMSTGKFLSYKAWRILDSPNEGVTYSAQYFFEDLEDFAAYLSEFDQTFSEEIYLKYGEKVVSFSSTMQGVL